jgi:hypothetical protein
MRSLLQALSRDPAIASPRKIICTAALAAVALLAVPGWAVAARQQRLVRAGLSQAGRELIFTLRTDSPLPLAKLEPRPDARRAGSRYLCLALSRAGSKGERRICLGGPKARRRVGVEALNASGKTIESGGARATVKRPNPQKLVVAVVPAAAGLAPRRYTWRVLESDGCRPGGRCAQSLPATGSFAFRLRPVRAVGCSGGSGGLLTNGPRDRKAVALTFDDGPSEYTPGFLDVLREKHVHATFFEIGQEVAGRERTMRRILREGDEIGNHTMHHATLPGYSEIAEASARPISSPASSGRPAVLRIPR